MGPCCFEVEPPTIFVGDRPRINIGSESRVADVCVVSCGFLIMFIYKRNQHVHRYHHHVLYLCHVFMKKKNVEKKNVLVI